MSQSFEERVKFLESQVAELDAAIVLLLNSFMTGQHYNTQNPYTRPEVKGALLALKETRGFAGDWMDVLKDF